MRVLIIVPKQDRISGNWVTATRFKQQLETRGCEVMLHGAWLDDHSCIGELAQRFKPDVAILLHAYRSGRPWSQNDLCHDIPYVVMLTGTDLNQGMHHLGQSQVIQTLLEKAQAIIIQNPLQATEFAKQQPALKAKIKQPAPGITLGTTPYDLRERHALDKKRPLFLCPAGLRPVKGLYQLLEMFAELADEHAFTLAFCGPILEENYAERLLTAVKQRAWAYYLGPIPAEAMAHAMRGADVILNNSEAEGLSNTLLEAASLGIPILARNILGNAAIVEHNRNGLLYDNVEGFVDCALRMLDKKEREALAGASVNRYSPAQETEDLLNILQAVMVQ